MYDLIKEFRNKTVINAPNGCSFGCVMGFEFDKTDNRLLAISVSDNIKIPWTCIEHIGKNFIVVNVKSKLEKAI